MNFRHLLLPIAPDQQLDESFKEVLYFANENSANVTLLTVIEGLDEYIEISHYTGTTLGLLDNATKFYHQSLKHHVHAFRAQYPSIKFATLIKIGVPFIEIIKAAHEVQSSLIVIDTHRKKKSKPCQYGSTTRHLMRKSDIPIWSCSMKPMAIRRVGVAVDVSNQEQVQFNEKILSLSMEFCSLTDAELILIHAWRLDTEGFLRKWSGYSQLDVALLAKKMREDHAGRMKSLLKPYENNLVKRKIKLLEGDAKQIIPSFIDKESIDMVIMGSLARAGIAGFLIGNTAESMLDQLSCSVLTLKPNEFHSPVLG
ncbi:universal stress protein [Photobacterium sp. SP02]|uniref:universal stress protein n=1 Tax=Photobacterium sp. SP02 TaxID=3032280 RepID=UPI003145260E